LASDKEEPLKFGPNLAPLNATVNYLRKLLEAIAEKQGIDIEDLNPPPEL